MLYDTPQMLILLLSLTWGMYIAYDLLDIYGIILCTLRQGSSYVDSQSREDCLGTFSLLCHLLDA